MFKKVTEDAILPTRGSEYSACVDVFKICSKCNKKKSIDNFPKQKKGKYGVASACLICKRKDFLLWKRTKNGLISTIYNHQKSHSKDKNRPVPSYTKEEFKKWILSNPMFDILYSKWVKSGFKMSEIPSVDRIDDSKGYSFDNIQLMTFKDNNKKAHKMMRDGTLINSHTPVIQYDKDMNFIAEFSSQKEAEEKTGINRKNISKACNCNGRKAGGFYWKIGQLTLLEHKSYLFGIESEDERDGGFGSTGK